MGPVRSRVRIRARSLVVVANGAVVPTAAIESALPRFSTAVRMTYGCGLSRCSKTSMRWPLDGRSARAHGAWRSNSDLRRAAFRSYATAKTRTAGSLATDARIRPEAAASEPLDTSTPNRPQSLRQRLGSPRFRSVSRARTSARICGRALSCSARAAVAGDGRSRSVTRVAAPVGPGATESSRQGFQSPAGPLSKAPSSSRTWSKAGCPPQTSDGRSLHICRNSKSASLGSR